MKPTPRIKKIEELESIRGLAALLIVFFHIRVSIFHCSVVHFDIVSRIAENGYLMVELFFVLSGFVISAAYCDNITTFKQLIRFQFLRFGRLYPIHFLFLLIYLFLEITRYVVAQRWGGVILGIPPFEKNNLEAFFQHLFLLQAIGTTGNEVTFNGAAWSISTEFYTYLIFGLTVLFAARLRQVIFILICAFSIMLLVNEATFGFENLLRCTAGFFLGCLCHEVSQRVNVTLPAYLSGLALTSILVFLAFKPSREFDFAIDFLTAIAILTVVHSRHGLVKTLLKSKALTWVGAISYSLYMSHALILWCFEFVFLKIIKIQTTTINGSLAIDLTLGEATITSTVFMVSVLLVSYVLFRFVEMPMREISRRAVHLSNG